MAIMVTMFLLFLACCVRAVLLSSGVSRREYHSIVLGRWSLGLQQTYCNEGFSTEKVPEIRRWFLMNYYELGVLFFIDFEGYIRRNRYVFNKVYWEAMKNEKIST